ncbi:hypothetical protein J5N97_001498 [Dioscorea zingiberensis]|uniref:Uncharacterized protein n=1 Tax=Dioscorea zingiberensis TaxID=325984 RepID=A0A9D5BTP9_9LILI|nr:hypothetical protein J5N97_001498 [Dioscorea zingiberensis]
MWQKVSSLKRKISSPRADEHSDFNACSTSSVIEKGHFFVYTSEGKRFMIPLAYIDNNIFKELLKISEEEFGLPGNGPITVPCDAASMDYVLSMLRRGVSQEVESPLSFLNHKAFQIKKVEHEDWQDMKMELSNALSTSCDTPRLSMEITYSMDTASQGNVMGPLPRRAISLFTSDGKRFMVPLAYLDNNIFKELLKISEEEFGLPGDGPITLPCDAVSMEKPPVQVKNRMAWKWQIAAALGRRRISPEKTNASSDSEACTPTTTYVSHKGHFIVYTSDGKRFMVPLEFLDTRIFQELLRMSEEEYGLPGDGPITLHCDAVSMEYILLLLKKQVSKDVEMALLSSIWFLTNPHVPLWQLYTINN